MPASAANCLDLSLPPITTTDSSNSIIRRKQCLTTDNVTKWLTSELIDYTDSPVYTKLGMYSLASQTIHNTLFLFK